MKTAAKVFIILGMFLGLFAIYPLILGLIALDKLDTAANSDDLKCWGIITLLLISPIGGILMLSMKYSDLLIESQSGNTNASNAISDNEFTNNKTEVNDFILAELCDEL